jgi:Sulfotransferase family
MLGRRGKHGKYKDPAQVMKPVIVLGPHRSGTSVTTRVVSLLGLSLCAPEDRLVKWDNPTGHWESQSLMGLNDELLGKLHGFWWAPPELADGWHASPDLDAFRRRAVERFHQVHPAPDWVWKDPRLCLTLPFWTAALEVDPVCVVTVRHPSEAADSMIARDGFGPRHVLALWEAYTASMLHALPGRPVAVVRYRQLVADPATTVARLRDDLAALGAAVSDDVGPAAAFVDAGRRHHRSDRAGCPPAAAQEDLHQRLDGLENRYHVFPELDLPPLSRSTAELLTMHRRFQQLQVDYEERTEWALTMKRELERRDETILAQQDALDRLDAAFEERTRWALELERELAAEREALRRLRSGTRG